MRRRGRGPARTIGRTAVVAGTATVVAKGVSNKMDSKEEAKEQEAQAQVQPPAEASPEAPAPADDDGLADQLQKLSALKESGALSDEEFSAAKAKLLGS